MITPYTPDLSLAGKLRRRLTRLIHKRPVNLSLDGAVVSFTFDDIPASAASEGARALEDANVRGTFYVCAGLFDQEGHMGRFANEAEIRGLIERGHEVAGHTYQHIDCHRSSSQTLEMDLDRNDSQLTKIGAQQDHFAYPYGEVSPRAKRQLAERYASLRGVHKGLVRSGSDLNQLPSVGIEGPDGEATAKAWIDRAITEKAWLILYTHDVRDQPSPWGCTPQALRNLISYAQSNGAVAQPLGQVLEQ